ncbi:SH3 domain-containing protein, partial [Phormidium sp. CCY1219]|uniref:SH3 domain-containing protein n=1 Tax=Phormidium sp. CCY1219 TaxID=2886104 RepID=UPI002D1E8ACE
GLNCRSGPGTEYSVVEVKSPNERLFLASIHFGGGPPYINFDERGLPWLKVDGGYETYCFVRANTLFIEPTRER